MKTAHFSIQSMHCNGCAQTIQHTLERQEGVQSCSVSFDEGIRRS
ncbi:MAG: heavy-metal-associated domain-containing protein [Xanthomonadaceae bacterium]|nr:heavy-metal-associated domain-containing protein [Xanthomonadaceae bacterium]MBU6477392.1 heavy-metal-associated domain-containing protein [Xanthomonadaceae bacterium]MDE2224902.1 heavy-metal-associated domain-containing protein [Xanthomonadaceae bacterium]MDE2496966.1 heavy-metal-associated domain-containing protein [Xanthomonadaceae bacterium]TAN03268.1 MAG: heavy-metal-associated domain-containing protein [Rhodanobacteraceae bacterium]